MTDYEESESSDYEIQEHQQQSDEELDYLGAIQEEEEEEDIAEEGSEKALVIISDDESTGTKRNSAMVCLYKFSIN